MKVNLHTFAGSWMIFDQCHVVWRAVAIKPNTCEHVCHTFWGYGDEGMTHLNSCQVIKSLALFGVMWQTTQLI